MTHARVLPVLVAAAFALVHAAALAQSPTETAASIITRYRVEQAPTPVRERAGWRTPPKILLLQFRPDAAGRDAAFAAVAPRARIVVAADLNSAIKEAADADVIIGNNPLICDARILDAAKELRWLYSLNAGIDLCGKVPSLRTRNIMMTNMRGMDGPAIAEHAIAMMLTLAHGLDAFALDTSKGAWSRQTAGTFRKQVVGGKTMLVVGLGGIGTEVAQRAHGLGMRVVATRQGGTGKPDFVSHVGQPDELLALARQADVIVSCVPLTPETTGQYDAKFFATLKPTALFINVARGASVVTNDLVAALNERRIAGAGLDVTDPEPLPAGHPLWRAPRVLITPHISGQSDLNDEPTWTLAVENLRRYAAGERMLSVVDLARGY